MTAALDAIARIDFGLDLPGDRELADVFDRHLQWEADRLAAEPSLAEACPACESGRGPVCAGCRIDGGVPA